MAARQLTNKKPKHLGRTLRTLLTYMGRHKYLLLAVAVLVTISALANLLGTYMIRPVVNTLTEGTLQDLAAGVLVTAGIYALGALSAFGYTQIMVKAAQKILYDIRRDLFAHLQTLPLRFFDTRRHGDIMSYFTNDVDTISDALNNSFAMVIQSFIQVVGTMVVLFILNWRLSLIVAVCYGLMFLYIRFSGRHSKAYYARQQASLGDLDGYIEEIMAGQKVVKVFNHEEESLRSFREKNEALRRAGTGAQSYAATMIPAVVAISYFNYAIVAVVGGVMAITGMTDVGVWPAIWSLSGRPPCPSTSLPSSPTSSWRPWPGRSGSLTRCTSPRRWTREGWIWSVSGRKPEGWAPVPRKPAAGPGAERTAPWCRCGGMCALSMWTLDTRPDHPILQDISLYAKPGQKIAFVGSTGAGKTTITNLINRFYEVDGGRVLYDGIDVREYPEGCAAPQPGHCAPGHPSVYRHHRRQHPLRKAGRHR